MNANTLARLDTARDLARDSFCSQFRIPIPGARPVERAQRYRAHTLGRAVDIRCNTDGNRFRIIQALMKAGFRRIGIAKTYIHADDSPNHTQNVTWLY